MKTEKNRQISLEDLGFVIVGDGELKPSTLEAGLVLASARSRIEEAKQFSVREAAMLSFIDFERQKYQETGYLGLVFGQGNDSVLVYRHPVDVSDVKVRYLLASRYGFAWLDFVPRDKYRFDQREQAVANSAGLDKVENDETWMSDLLSFNHYMFSAVAKGGVNSEASVSFINSKLSGMKVPLIGKGYGGNSTKYDPSSAIPVAAEEIGTEVLQYLAKNEERFQEVVSRSREAAELVNELIGNQLDSEAETETNGVKDKRSPSRVLSWWYGILQWLGIE